MTIEHEVVEVDGLVVECWRDGNIEASASSLGAWWSLVGVDDMHRCSSNPDNDEPWCRGPMSTWCPECLALRAHIRLKEQR